MNSADQKRLIEIVQRIERIERYTVGVEEEEFYENELVRDACHANLIIIAEAVTRLSGDIKEEHQEIDWKDITGFRNLIIHEYFRINWVTVWQVIKLDLKQLKGKLERILNEGA